MFHEGRQIGGYTLLRKLGKGGFGEVWLAEKRSQFVTKKVAVKLPLDEQVNLDAIRQEAELWEQASGHPNVLPIIDADIIDSQVVIVSEYAEGGSLADRIKQGGRLSLQKAVEMTIGILSGLEFLHSRRIIHRDIKPQNILLQGDTPRLADFGISRAMNTTVISSAIIGTDAYMSPESFDGKRTVQTDIWSVGVVLYALLGDKLPFPQEHPSERMFAILTKEFEPLPPEVPQNLQRIVRRALAKQPENRYQTTAEMRDELQKVLVGIVHPTFAPTEVFEIRTENLPTIPTVENRSETVEAEAETVVELKNAYVPAPPQSSARESIVTNLKIAPAAPSAANSSPPHQVKPDGKAISDKAQRMFFSPPEKDGKSSEFKFVVGLAVALAVILGIGFLYSKNSLSVPTSANRAANLASNLTTNPGFPMSIELKLRTRTSLLLAVDGASETFSEPLEVRRFTAYEIFEMTYSEPSSDEIQLKINSKNISLPKVSGNSNGVIKFTVNRDNYNRILQSGDNPGKASNSN